MIGWLFRHRRRVRIDIACPHGRFFPGTHRIGRDGRYGCKDCPLTVEVSWQRGELDV